MNRRLAAAAAALAIGGAAVATSEPFEATAVIDAAGPAGIAETTRTFGAAALDYDQDGDPDLLLNRHNAAPSRLYRNNGDSTFTETSVGLFALKDRHHCVPGDLNRDGWPDLYCTVGGDGGAATGLNELWLNNEGVLTNAAATMGVTDPYGRGRYAAWLNANGDEWPDLFVGNAGPRSDGRPAPSRLFINNAGMTLTGASGFGLNNEFGAECAYPGDFNGDGRDDLLVCGNTRLMFWMSNTAGTYTNKATAFGLSGYQHDAAFADVNADGQLDFVQVAPSRVTMRLGLTGGTGLAPQVTLRTTTYAIHLRVWDLENDGDPDLYVSRWNDGTNHPPDFILVNDGTGAFAPLDMTQVDGAGDHATSIDYDGDGIDELVVANGYGVEAGPVQLLEF